MPARGYTGIFGRRVETRECFVMILFVILLNVLVVAINRLQWGVYRSNTYLIGYFVYALMFLFVAVSFIISLKVRKNVKNTVLRYIPLLLTTTTAAYITVLPFSSVFSAAEFRLNYNAREKFVSSLSNTEPVRIDENDCKLPPEMFYLSKDGSVKNDNNNLVLFQTHRFGRLSVNVLYNKNTFDNEDFFSYSKNDIVKQTDINGNWHIIILNEM